MSVGGFPLLPLVPCCTNHSVCHHSCVCVCVCARASDCLRERVFICNALTLMLKHMKSTELVVALSPVYI